MNQPAKWGVITVLTLGLISPLFWHGLQPTPLKRPGAAETPQSRQAQIQALQAKKSGGNERVVAKDIAQTAALCVRDCRVMLTEISNELAHVRTDDERLKLLQHHMKEHAQFVSLTFR